MLNLFINQSWLTPPIKKMAFFLCLIFITSAVYAESADLLIGEIQLEDLQQPAFTSWFEGNYKGYSPDPDVMEQLRPLMDDVSIMLFMGTWCHDSQREVPRLVKLLQIAAFEQSNLQIIGLSTTKTTPSGVEQLYKIERTPTILFFHNGVEIGRIVEKVKKTLEQDILTIVKESAI